MRDVKHFKKYFSYPHQHIFILHWQLYLCWFKCLPSYWHLLLHWWLSHSFEEASKLLFLWRSLKHSGHFWESWGRGINFTPKMPKNNKTLFLTINVSFHVPNQHVWWICLPKSKGILRYDSVHSMHVKREIAMKYRVQLKYSVSTKWIFYCNRPNTLNHSVNFRYHNCVWNFATKNKT